jgi:hypothetical protein
LRRTNLNRLHTKKDARCGRPFSLSTPPSPSAAGEGRVFYAASSRSSSSPDDCRSLRAAYPAPARASRERPSIGTGSGTPGFPGLLLLITSDLFSSMFGVSLVGMLDGSAHDGSCLDASGWLGRGRSMVGADSGDRSGT